MTITLPCFGIIIELTGQSGTITSDLKDGSDDAELTAAMDAIESLILAHACVGVDVASPAYVQGIETAVETCWNKLG
jgi:hypothetical protein